MGPGFEPQYKKSELLKHYGLVLNLCYLLEMLILVIRDFEKPLVFQTMIVNVVLTSDACIQIDDEDKNRRLETKLLWKK